MSESASFRSKRSVGQFGDMIRFATKKEALLYNNDGNHCGSQNDINASAVDEIDQ